MNLNFFEKWKQLIAAIIVNSITGYLGVIFGWIVQNYEDSSSVTLLGLDDDNKEALKHFIESVAFLRRLPFVCALVALGVATFNAKVYGRKTALVVSIILFLTYSLTMAIKTKQMGVILGMIFGTSSCAMHLYVVPMYVYEISSEHRRGRNAIIGPMFLGIGIYLGYFQTAVHLHPSYLPLIFGLVSLIILRIIPESPVWLAKNKRHDDLKEAMNWLQIEAMPTIVYENQALDGEAKTDAPATAQPVPLTSSLGIASVLLICQAVVMLNWILVHKLLMGYAWNIDTAFGQHITSTSVIVISNILVFLAIDYIGRRKFLLSSCILMFIALCMAGSLHSESQGNVRFLYSMPIIMATICGFGSVSSIIAVEIIPRSDVSNSFAICSIIFWITIWIQAEIWQVVMRSLAINNWCFFNAFIHVLLAVSTYFLVPETKAERK